MKIRVWAILYTFIWLNTHLHDLKQFLSDFRTLSYGPKPLVKPPLSRNQKKYLSNTLQIETKPTLKKSLCV